MSRHFNTAVRSAFERCMADEPRFAAWRERSPYLWPGERAWRWDASPTLSLWVILSPSPKGYNEFTVEVGWSALGRFPELSMRPSAGDPRDDGVHERSEFVCRLGAAAGVGDRHWAFGTAPESEDPGGGLGAEAMPEPAMLLASLGPAEAGRAAAPLVTDAYSLLQREGIPFLERARRMIESMP